MAKKLTKKCLWCEQKFKTDNPEDELCETCAKFPNKTEAMKHYRLIHKIFH